jgi:phosphohistidine phosphatase
MNIFLLRHGIAVDPGTAGFDKDSERTLTPKGERKLWQVADAMFAMKLSFDAIFTSPYVRARQTADIIAEALDLRKKLQEVDHLTPGGSARRLIETINSIKPAVAEVLLVGHEPSLSELISLLISGDTPASVLMKKGGLCKLSADSLQHGRCATLEWLLMPKQMGLMA